MGYTMENKKAVIWTEKVAEPWQYPFQDEVTNYTYFYTNHLTSFIVCDIL